MSAEHCAKPSRGFPPLILTATLWDRSFCYRHWMRKPGLNWCSNFPRITLLVVGGARVQTRASGYEVLVLDHDAIPPFSCPCHAGRLLWSWAPDVSSLAEAKKVYQNPSQAVCKLTVWWLGNRSFGCWENMSYRRGLRNNRQLDFIYRFDLEIVLETLPI